MGLTDVLLGDVARVAQVRRRDLRREQIEPVEQVNTAAARLGAWLHDPHVEPAVERELRPKRRYPLQHPAALRVQRLRQGRQGSESAVLERLRGRQSRPRVPGVQSGWPTLESAGAGGRALPTVIVGSEATALRAASSRCMRYVHDRNWSHWWAKTVGGAARSRSSLECSMRNSLQRVSANSIAIFGTCQPIRITR